QQRMVGHDDVGVACLLPRALGETLHAERATLCSQALAGADRDLAPCQLAHAGNELVAVAGLGGSRPLVESLHLQSGRRERAWGEQRLASVVGRTAANPLQAQVVPASLEDCEDRLPAKRGRDRLSQARQVTVDELALQRDRSR